MMPIKQDFGINWRYGDEKSKGHCMLLSTNQARTSQTTPLYSPKIKIFVFSMILSLSIVIVYMMVTGDLYSR